MNFIFLLGIIVSLLISDLSIANEKAAEPWNRPKVDINLAKNILYLPISHPEVKAIPIIDSGEELIDLLKINNPRIKSLALIDKNLCPAYDGYSKVRLGLYLNLIKMLDYLPQDVGIAFCEGLRPLAKQKEYFDKKFKELFQEFGDYEKAYRETSKVVSPFINNIPTHCTGAAIDMTLFKKTDNSLELLEMGKFDTILGYNAQEEIFSKNTNLIERENRLLLLNAATNAGFVSYGYEWWHYSYGDKMWAYVKGQKNAIYGLAVPKNDPILLIDQESYFRTVK